MAGPAIAFNQPGLDEQLPAHIAQVEQALARARGATPAGDTASLSAHLARDRFFLDQKRGARHVLATRTFTDSLVIQLDRRRVVVKHTDRAITPGDAWLWLPDERIAVVGDLLINPITFALFCYPSGWIRTLQTIDALDAAVLVPGHGAPMRDENVLRTTLQLLGRERMLASAAKTGGRTVDQAKTEILADSAVLGLRDALTGGNAQQNQQFALYMVDWFVRRVYQELDGTLDDSIPKLPG
jgi:glyoxylase-like metal-dependent hydrolase (beta-lactamase superfamily II)